MTKEDQEKILNDLEKYVEGVENLAQEIDCLREMYIEEAMDGRISDLENTINISKYIGESEEIILTEPVADWHVVFHALKGVGYNPTTMEPLDDHWSMHESKEDAEAHYERVQDLRNFHSGGYARITEGSDW